MNRRDFMMGAFAAGTAGMFSGCCIGDWLKATRHPKVGEVWTGWHPGEFQVHFIYTGVAESQFLIFPDGTSMLLDCGDHPAHKRGIAAVKVLPSLDRHAGEWIARYVTRVNPSKDHVDYMLLSHFHSDHGGCDSWHAGMTEGRNPDYFLSGFAQAAEMLHFDVAIDRGWPNYDDPIKLPDSYSGNLLKNMKALYSYLQRRDGLKVEKFDLGSSDQIVQRRNGDGKTSMFKAFNFAANGRICSPKDGKVTDLYKDIIAARKPKGLNENALSLGTLFTYGNFSYYTAGDFSDNRRMLDGKRRQIEEDLALIMPRVDVAKINHHGHHAMYPGLSKALNARCYVSCIWDQYHCTDDTMAYLEAVPGDHMYFPGIVPTFYINRDGGKRRPWMAKCPEPMWEGAHTVLTVQPGGADYSMTCIGASDESMVVKAVFDFKSM